MCLACFCPLVPGYQIRNDKAKLKTTDGCGYLSGCWWPAQLCTASYPASPLASPASHTVCVCEERGPFPGLSALPPGSFSELQLSLLKVSAGTSGLRLLLQLLPACLVTLFPRGSLLLKFKPGSFHVLGRTERDRCHAEPSGVKSHRSLTAV